MKQNDWIALNLNIQGSGIDVDNLRMYNITPDNTGIKDKDYYKTIPQVQKAFTDNTTGVFNEDAFTQFYNSAKRSYTDFVSNDYAKELVNQIPVSRNDIFSLGNVNLRNDSAYVFNTKDPNRHSMGIGNIFETGAPSFSVREVAQANKVVDENGKTLDWTPNDKGGLWKALFRPTLALAEYDKNEYDADGNIVHYKGETKLNQFGDPYYEILGSKETYGKDVLRYADTLTKEGTWINKVDIFDRDGLKTSTGKTIAWMAASILPFLTPYGYAFGALKAAIDLGQTMPVLIKMLNGMIMNDDTDLSRSMTSVENFMSRFGRSESDYARQHRWGFEGVAQMVVDSAGQLYSQRLIQKIPGYLADLKDVPLSAEGIRHAKMLSSAYMATTSAKEVYGDYRQAGLNQQMAGIGALATMGAYYAFMQHEYFKDMLFRDAAIDMPELKIALNRVTKASQEKLMARQAAKAGAEQAKKVTKELIANPEKSWYKTVYNTVGGALKKAGPTLKSLTTAESPYLYTSRSLNEGIEEVMEEGVADFFKGISLGLNALGVDVKDKYAEKIDFNWTPENFLERYATAFVGGAIGGAVFEGLTQWDNKVLHRNISRISDLEDVDEQLTWYIRNGYGDDLLKLVNQWEKKGRFGSKDLSWNYKVQDGKIVYDEGTPTNNQNTAMANIIRDRIKYKQGRLETLGLNISDNEIILKAAFQIAQDAKKEGYTNLEKYQREKLRDARVEFLKQTGVDRYILTDVADLQADLMKTEETIENLRAELQNVPDKVKSEQPKDTEEIKRLEKHYKEKKEALDRILDGTAASEYIQLSMFLSDDVLSNLYTSDLTGKDDTWYEKSVANYVRSRYHENYNELDDKSKALFEAEFDEWKKAEKRKDRVRYAYGIHELLSKIISPVIDEQSKNYSGYKLEEGRAAKIQGVLEEFYLQEQQRLEKEQIKVTETGDLAQLKNIQDQLSYINETLNYIKNPKFVLDESYDATSGFFKTYAESVQRMDAKTALDLLVKYYSDLNSSQTVSEFSDDILKQTLVMIGSSGLLKATETLNAMRKTWLLEMNEYKGLENLVQVWTENPELQNTYHDIVDDEGNVTKKSEAQILQDLYNAWKDAYTQLQLKGEGNGQFKYNGKVRFLHDHLMDDTLLSKAVIFDEDESFSPFQGIYDKANTVKRENDTLLDDKSFEKLNNAVSLLANSFAKEIADIKSAYSALATELNEAIVRKSIGISDPNGFIASIMFDNEANLLAKLDQIQQLRADMIHTPILDWINALSIQLKGQPTNLWQMLVNEVKGLESKATLDQYTIDNPFALQELYFLQGALLSAQAVLRGAQPNGVNTVLNQMRLEDGLEPLVVIGDEQLAEVYQHDLNIIGQRISYLLDLHEKNNYGTVKQKKLTYIQNAPKFISAILKTSTAVNEEKPEVFIASKLPEIGIPDIKALWSEAGGDSIVLEEVSEENFEEFWTAYRNFQNLIYDAVSKWNPTDGNKVQRIAKTLVSGFTDVWKLKTSDMSALESSRVENFDVLMWLAGTIALDPKTTHGLLKTVKGKTGVTPFFDQSLGIELGLATAENGPLFNAIIDELANAATNALSKLDIEEQPKKYLEARTKAYNAVFADGSSGTGKSRVVLRFVHEMRKLLHPDLASIAVSEHIERATALKESLGIGDDSVFSKSALFKLILGRDLTTDDFVEGTYVSEDGSTKKTGHAKILSDKTRKEILEKTKNWSSLLKGHSGLDVYVDESGFLSEGDMQLLTESIGTNNIKIFYAGDAFQNGCIVTTTDGSKVTKTNSGTFDVLGIMSLRLNLSMRSGNLGMVKNLQHLESKLKQFLDVFKNEPWLNSEGLTKKVAKLYGTLTPFKFNFYEDSTGLYGIAFTTDPEESLAKLEKFAPVPKDKPNIVIITDNLDKWKSKRSKNIDVLDVGQVQGGEYDYALVDVESFGDSQDFDYLRNIYTIVSRARKGVYVNGKIGEWFPETTISDMDVNAAIEVNATANSEERDTALEDYGEFWDNLYKNEIWSSKTPASPSGPAKPSTGGTGGTPAGTGSVTTTGALTPKVETQPGEDGFNLDKFLEDIETNGSKSKYLQGYFSKTKLDDYKNYQKYRAFLSTNDGNGTTIETKDFIDWLFTPGTSANDILFGNTTYSILNGMGSLTEEQQTKYKDLVRALSMDLLQLSKSELHTKYVDKSLETRQQWDALFPNNNVWKDRVTSLFNTIEDVRLNDGIELYSVIDGEYAYLYHVANVKNSKWTFPIARVKNLAQSGPIKLSLTRITPEIIVSTNGSQFKRLSDVVGKYLDITSKAYIVSVNPNKIAISPKSTLRSFIIDMLGNPMVVLSSTFYDGDGSNLLEPVMDNDDKSLYFGIDQTQQTDGKRRFSAVSSFVTFTKWLELARVLDGIRRSDINLATDPRLNELNKYLSNQSVDGILAALNNPDPSDKLFNLAKANLLSDSSRDLLTTALIRYFFTIKDSDPDTYNKFLGNLVKWNTDKWISLNGQFERQRMFSVTLYGNNSTREVYHIAINDDAEYDVLTKISENGINKEAIIGTLKPEEWIDMDKANPITMLQSVLRLVKSSRGTIQLADGNVGTFLTGELNTYFNTDSDLDESAINELLKSGTVTFGITVRSEKIEDVDSKGRTKEVLYYAPFDPDIANLLDGIQIVEGGKLDEFLKSDSKFKYNFIVNTPGVSEKAGSFWLHTEKAKTNTQNMLTDVGLVLPPLFQGDFKPVDNARFSGLYSLNHKVVTDNPAENELTVTKVNGVEQYTLQKYFVVDQQTFVEQTGITSVATPTVTIVKATENSVTILDGGQRTFNNLKKNPKGLFDGIPVKTTVADETKLLDNGTAQLYSSNTGLKIKINTLTTTNLKLVYETDEKIAFLVNKQLIEFDKTASDIIGDPKYKLAQGDYIGASPNNGGSLELYFLQGTNLLVYNVDFGGTLFRNVVLYNNDTLMEPSTKIEITKDPNIIKRLRNVGIKQQVHKKGDKIVEAIKALAGNKTDISEIGTKMSAKEANRWLRAHAIDLGGIFKWDTKLKEIVSDNSDEAKVLFAFAYWMEAEGLYDPQEIKFTAQSVIDYNPEIIVHGDDDTQTTYAEIKLPIYGNLNNSFNFKVVKNADNVELELVTNDSLPEPLTVGEFLKTQMGPAFSIVTDEDLKYLTLYAKWLDNQNVNTNDDQYIEWMGKHRDSSDPIKIALTLIRDAFNDVDDNTACVFKFN